MQAVSKQIFAAASDLLVKAGLSCCPCNIVQMVNGKNNQVFKVDCGSRNFLLKHYFKHSQDLRDRQGAELAFLFFCQKNNITSVPKIFSCNKRDGWSLFEWLDGRPAVLADINKKNAEYAASFFQFLANAKSSCDNLCLSPAAESCFSIQNHIDIVKRRLEQLLQWQLCRQGCIYASQAEDLVRTILFPAFQNERKYLEQRYGKPELLSRIPWNEIVPSPSDAGFHNILIMQNGLGFVDFEYAGLDDAAKLFCDFTCQPSFPVPFELLREALIKNFFPGLQNIINRIEDVLMLHRIKWCCIMLNVFNPANAERRIFAGADSSFSHIRKVQLEKCNNYIKKYISAGEYAIY